MDRFLDSVAGAARRKVTRHEAFGIKDLGISRHAGLDFR